MNILVPAGSSGPNKTQYFINQAYARYVSMAGYKPVLAVPESDIEFLATVVDGLLLPGGIDIDPVFYNEDNHRSFSVDPVRDDFERRAFHAFLEVGKPIFGICRGFQLIAREFLRMDIPECQYLEFRQHVSGHNMPDDLGVARNYPSHSVKMMSGELYEGDNSRGWRRAFVNSMHHQALMVRCPPKKNGKGARNTFDATHGVDGGPRLTITAYTNYEINSKFNGSLVEAFDIEGWGESRIRAVQWHPEELQDVNLLKSFFEGENNGAARAEG